MKKSIKISLIVLVLTLTMIMSGCKESTPLATSENPFGLIGMDIRPDIEGKIDIDIDSDDQIALAVQLYEIACDNDKEVDCRAYYSYCPTNNVAIGMNNKILLNILEVKSGDEYFRIDYRLRDDIPLFNYMPGSEDTINKFIKLVTTERRYANTDMDHTLYEQVLNASTTEEGIPYANWSNESDIIKFTDPSESPSKPRVFSKNQEGVFRKTEHVIDQDTVKSATVTYDEEDGIYSVRIELDCTLDENDYNKATEFTRPYILEGANSKDAHYTDIIIEFDLWDNGYFKEYYSTEKWFGHTVLNLEVSSEFLYKDVFSYDERDCVISKFYKDGDFVDDYYKN
ncbi:MAG: hypothetical protein ACOX3U_07335 [Christensenellales bacterium]|jgi:hypothetical protein